MKISRTKAIRIAVFFYILFSHLSHASAGERRDSLLSLLDQNIPVSQKAIVYRELAKTTIIANPDTALYYSEKGLELAKSLTDTMLMANLHSYIGALNFRKSNYSQATEHLFEASGLCELADNDESVQLLSFIYNNLGAMYRELNRNKEAEKYYKKALYIRLENKDSVGIAHSYNNLGILQMLEGNYEKGMGYWKKSLDVKLAIGDEKGASSTMSNMAKYYGDIGETEKALKMHHRARKMDLKYKDYEGVSMALSNIGDIYLKQKDYDEAIKNYSKALKYADSSKSLVQQRDMRQQLSNAYQQKGAYKQALEYHKEYTEKKDQILNEKSQKQISEIETKYQTEKKELEIESLKKSKALQQAEIEKKDEAIKREYIQKVALGGGLVLTLLMVFLILKSYRRKKKDNEIISRQKSQVEHQKQLVEEKNNEIIHSINYSKRLQDAILPPLPLIKTHLPESFILYKPKDIIAGDFYWFESKEEELFFAAADCTGHGVPGAMVSVICHNALNRAVNEMGLTNPAQILDKVSELVEETFEKSEETVSDGMDISLCTWNKKTLQLQFAGANNPLWIIRKGVFEAEEIKTGLPSATSGRMKTDIHNSHTLMEIKADKQPIGNYVQRRPFTNHEIQLEGGEQLYMFSDGYPDQFGGEKGKKLKPKNMKKILLSHCQKPMEVQRQKLEEHFETWKGDLEQIDDVCVFGVRV